MSIIQAQFVFLIFNRLPGQQFSSFFCYGLRSLGNTPRSKHFLKVSGRGSVLLSHFCNYAKGLLFVNHRVLRGHYDESEYRPVRNLTAFLRKIDAFKSWTFGESFLDFFFVLDLLFDPGEPWLYDPKGVCSNSFTVGATIPIALLMGCYMRFVRAGKVLEASGFGIALLLLAVWGGKLVYQNQTWSQHFSLHGITLAWAIIGYGVISSSLPVWLLLAPRDYLSTFMKLGTICALAFGILFVLPGLQLPALTRFTDGSGLVVAGKVFPFCFITIACGAISGFHTLIASGTTPKMITRESYARQIGYGAMCCESFVAIMALIAACALDPGVYFSMNVKGDPVATVAQVTALGYPVTTDHMNSLANQLGEKTLFGRTGGAATLAVGMAQIFSKAVNGRWLDLWYHFAIMFEALFILTTVDAGTRVGRYLIQSVLGRVWKPLGDPKNFRAVPVTAAVMVGAWGYFLIQGVRDPLGGINSLWPLFGIANQMLAAIALCLGTTIILKMQLQRRRLAAGREGSKAPETNISLRSSR